MRLKDKKLSQALRKELLKNKQDDFGALYEKLGLTEEASHYQSQNESPHWGTTKKYLTASVIALIFSLSTLIGSVYSIKSAPDSLFIQEGIEKLLFILHSPIISFASLFVSIAAIIVIGSIIKSNF